MVIIGKYKDNEINFEDKKFKMALQYCHYNTTSIEGDTETELCLKFDKLEQEKEEKQRKEQDEKAKSLMPDFTISLAEPSYLKSPVKIISSLCGEVRFKVTKDKIEMVAMDPANVSMIIFKLLSSCCVEYDVPREFYLSLNVVNLNIILQKCKQNDIVKLCKGKKKNDVQYLKIIFRGETDEEFETPTIELEEREQKIPDLKFMTRLKLHSSVLYNQIKTAKSIAESVIFRLEDKPEQTDKFFIEAEGDLSSYKGGTQAGDKLEVMLPSNEKSKYSIEYLIKMIEAKKLSEWVEISFHKDFPLMLEYACLDKLNLQFILAPRVENDRRTKSREDKEARE